MKKIGLDFLNYGGGLLVSVDSLVEAFEKNANYEAVDLIEHFVNELHLHRSGFSNQTNSICSLKPIKKPEAP